MGIEPHRLPSAGRCAHHDAHYPKQEEVAIKHDRGSSPLLATFAVTVLRLITFNYDHSAVFQFDVSKKWIPVIDAHYTVGIDGISLPLLALSAFITVLCVIYSWEPLPRTRTTRRRSRAHPDPRGRHERHVRGA